MLELREPEEVVEQAWGGDPNLDDSFIEENLETMAYDQTESDLDMYFYRRQRISCFAHNMMLAVKTVCKFIFGTSFCFYLFFIL